MPSPPFPPSQKRGKVLSSHSGAIVGYIKLTRRIVTAEHSCSECGNTIDSLDLYLTVYADGDTGPVVCGDCATD